MSESSPNFNVDIRYRKIEESMPGIRQVLRKLIYSEAEQNIDQQILDDYERVFDK